MYHRNLGIAFYLIRDTDVWMVYACGLEIHETSATWTILIYLTLLTVKVSTTYKLYFLFAAGSETLGVHLCGRNELSYEKLIWLVNLKAR